MTEEEKKEDCKALTRKCLTPGPKTHEQTAEAIKCLSESS